MPAVHLKDNWRKCLSWSQASWRTMPTSDRGGRDWDGRATSSLAADAASSTSERVERTESGGRKTSQMQQRYLNVTSGDLWCIRDKLSGKSGQSVQDKEAKKGLRIEPASVEVCGDLGIILFKFRKDMCREEAEDQFDRDFDESLKSLHPTTKIGASELRKIMHELKMMRVLRNHFQETASATLALTYGGLFAGQGYARRRLRGGRDREVGGMINEAWTSVTVLSGRVSCYKMSRFRWISCILVLFGSVVMGPHLGLRD